MSSIESVGSSVAPPSSKGRLSGMMWTRSFVVREPSAGSDPSIVYGYRVPFSDSDPFHDLRPSPRFAGADLGARAMARATDSVPSTRSGPTRDGPGGAPAAVGMPAIASNPLQHIALTPMINILRMVQCQHGSATSATAHHRGR